METLTETEFDLQWLESLKSNQIADNVRGFDEVRNNISKWSEDSYQTCNFASGIEVNLDYQ
jgi:AraC family transcriptional regulator, transcriptional activator of the genes for pyochelin and ferripyochelin receptors